MKIDIPATVYNANYLDPSYRDYNIYERVYNDWDGVYPSESRGEYRQNIGMVLIKNYQDIVHRLSRLEIPKKWRKIFENITLDSLNLGKIDNYEIFLELNTTLPSNEILSLKELSLEIGFLVLPLNLRTKPDLMEIYSWKRSDEGLSIPRFIIWENFVAELQLGFLNLTKFPLALSKFQSPIKIILLNNQIEKIPDELVVFFEDVEVVI